MIRPRQWVALCKLMVLTTAALLFLAGCEQPRAGTGAFRNAALVPTHLHRGVSTKTDAQALLGVPNGVGSSLFRNVAGGQRNIWYYEDDEATEMTAKGNLLVMALRQQLLLLFFKGDMFDGYLWVTNVTPAQIQ